MNPLLLAGLVLTLGWTWLFRRRVDRATTRRAAGQLLELLLYGDSPRVLGRVLASLSSTSWRLARQLLWPGLASLLLLGLVVVPLRHFVCWRPLRVGEPFLVAASHRPDAHLDYDGGLRSHGPPLLDRRRFMDYWRLVAEHPGSHRLGLQASADEARVKAGSRWAYVTPQQGRITIFYPKRDLWLGDHLISWPVGLVYACLFWMGLGLVFNCCWCVLVRQEAETPPRKR